MRGNAGPPGFVFGSVKGGSVKQPADQEGVLMRRQRGIGAPLNPLCDASYPG